MQVQVEPVEPRQVQLTIVVPPERIERAMTDVSQVMARRLHVSGYRPGKVPLRVVAARVGDEEVRKEALELLKEQAVREAIKQQDIKPWAPAEVEVLQDEPFTLKALVPLAPEVELPPYDVLRARQEPPAAVTDEEVEAVIDGWRQERAELQTVDRPAEAGDTLVVSFFGFAEGLEPIEQMGLQLHLTPESAQALGLPAGLVDPLVGAVAGESRSFPVTYSEFWPEASLQGRQVQFDVDVEAVMARVAPPLEELLDQAGPGVKTAEALRQRVRQELESRAAAEARDKQVEALVDSLVGGARVAYPPVALEQEVAATFVDLRQRIERQGLAWDRWLELQNKTADELWSELEPEATRQLRRRLVLRRFVEVEGIRVSPREIDEEVDRFRRPFGRSARRALPPLAALRRSAGSRMLSNRAVDRLLEIAAANAQGAGEREEPASA